MPFSEGNFPADRNTSSRRWHQSRSALHTPWGVSGHSPASCCCSCCTESSTLQATQSTDRSRSCPGSADKLLPSLTSHMHARVRASSASLGEAPLEISFCEIRHLKYSGPGLTGRQGQVACMRKYGASLSYLMITIVRGGVAGRASVGADHTSTRRPLT